MCERALLMHDTHAVHFRGIGQTSFDHVLEVKCAANVDVALINDDGIDSLRVCLCVCIQPMQWLGFV